MAKLAMRGPLNEGHAYHNLGPDPVCAETGQAFGFREWRFRNLESVQFRARWSSSFVRSRCQSCRRTRNRPCRNGRRGAHPARRDCPAESVNPPTTSSFVASHFILSQCLERRCSFKVTRAAWRSTPSHPALLATSHGFGLPTSVTRYSGGVSGSLPSSARRSSKGSAVTLRSSIQRMSKTSVPARSVPGHFTSRESDYARAGRQSIAPASECAAAADCAERVALHLRA